MSDITFFKPNELIAVIDQVHVNRLAKHMCNYLLKYAQEQIKFHNHKGSLFELQLRETNDIAKIGVKDYKLIEKSLDALMQPVTLRDKDDPKHYKKLVPIYEIDVNTELGLYRYKIADTMIELLRNSDYFTKLTLTEFNDLESKHSLVIYEYLKRYETAQHIPQISVDELRQITHTADKDSYDNFRRLQIKVIDVAVKEINEKTPYTVSYETIKTKKKRRPKVTALQFNFAKKEKAIKATYYYPIAEVTARYAELADKYAAAHRATREDFYTATYKVDYKCLLWFYENKHLPLRVLLDDIKTGRRQGRWKSQIDEYSVLVERLYPQRLQHLYGQDRLLMLDKQSCEGYLQQVLQMQAELDIAPVDINKWL